MTNAGLITADSVPEPLIDFQRLAAGIRWRRRLWLSLALVGLLTGPCAALLLPSSSTAAARVYVVHEQTDVGDEESLMKTDVAVLETTTVAQEAVNRLQIDVDVEEFAREYSGDAVAGHILEISATGNSDAQAVQRVQALADSFIAIHLRRSDEAANAEIKTLTERGSALENDLAGINARIEASPRTAPGLPELLARRDSLSTQIADLSQRAQEAALGSPRIVAGTRIIDAAHPTSRPAPVTAALYGAAGLVLGLGGGLVLAAIATVVRDRPVLRRDIAAHLGASVIAQLRPPIRGPRRFWTGSRAWSKRRRTTATIVRLLRATAGPVSLLELGCAQTAARMAREIANDLAHEGPVLLVDDLPGDQLHRAKTSPDSTVQVVKGADYPSASRVQFAAERVLGLGSVGPGTPWTDLRRLGPEALLIVRAGASEASWLHTVARQLADAGIAVIGVVVVHPDPRDRSDGTLWDGLHTAIRGRLAAAHSVTVDSSSSTGNGVLRTYGELGLNGLHSSNGAVTSIAGVDAAHDAARAVSTVPATNGFAGPGRTDRTVDDDREDASS